MAWREIATESSVWQVDPAVERRGGRESWQLVFSFRTTQADGRKSFWAPFPLESVSKSYLFQEADRIDDGELRNVLNDFLR